MVLADLSTTLSSSSYLRLLLGVCFQLRCCSVFAMYADRLDTSLYNVRSPNVLLEGDCGSSPSVFWAAKSGVVSTARGKALRSRIFYSMPAMDGWCCCGATARETIINSINGMKNTHRNNSGGLIIVSVCP